MHLSELAHAKVGHLGSVARAYQQHVVAGEVSVDDTVVVKVGQCECDVVADVDLHVVGKRSVGALQEVRQALVHELHEQNRQTRLLVVHHAQVLHYVGVADLAEEAALLLKLAQVGLVLGIGSVN